jgi:hypothetical protein
MRKLVFLTGLLCALNPAFGQNCDRQCLSGILTSYLPALVAHDPKVLPLAANVRFTEDTVEMPLGEGLWKTASGLGSFRQDIIDVRAGVAGTHVVVQEKGAPVRFEVRLKVASGKTSEIDTTVVRNQTEGMIYKPDQLKEASPAMKTIPDTARHARRNDEIRVVGSRRLESRQLRQGGRALRRRRVPVRKWPDYGRAQMHLHARLHQHRGAAATDAGRNRGARCRCRRGTGYCVAAHELWTRRSRAAKAL